MFLWHRLGIFLDLITLVAPEVLLRSVSVLPTRVTLTILLKIL